VERLARGAARRREVVAIEPPLLLVLATDAPGPISRLDIRTAEDLGLGCVSAYDCRTRDANVDAAKEAAECVVIQRS
jgi:hypothetical protein